MRPTYSRLALTYVLCSAIGFEALAQQYAQKTPAAPTALVTAASSKALNANAVQRFLSQNTYDFKINETVIDAANLRQLYKYRKSAPIWFDQNGPNAMAQAFKAYLQTAPARHGLSTSDYWLPTHDAAFSGQADPLASELLFTHTLIKYVNELSNGRFDPQQVDNDIRYAKKNFTEFSALSQILLVDATQLEAGLDSFAPTVVQYQDLEKALQSLLTIKATGGTYTTISSSERANLVVGEPNAVVPKLRQALIDRGYPISGTGVNFDDETLQAVQTLEADSNIENSASGLTKSSSVWSIFQPTIDDRINQISVNLERLRWLPHTVEDRRIFVNLAATELKLYENNQIVMQFRTVNGRPLRRTPSMRDHVVSVELNPTWTTPTSIGIKDILPKIQKNMKNLDDLNIRVVVKGADASAVTNPKLIDWNGLGNRVFDKYLLIQQPGVMNSLGVIKFNLTNYDSVYMHDTEDRDFFNHPFRLKSSGCIRLQKPLEFGTYVLQNEIYPMTGKKAAKFGGQTITGDILRQLVPDITIPAAQQPKDPSLYQTEVIPLSTQNQLPLYTLFLTSEVSPDNGRIRFLPDYYGQDDRISSAITRNSNPAEEY